MNICRNAHLSYCTNIHPGETWNQVFKSLKDYTIFVKKEFSPNTPFGIGLRLSKLAATELLQHNNLQKFKKWLDQNQLYVFTLNGFPYGEFHNVVIKDLVHQPDWTTKERLNYTKDLMRILAYLLPDGMDGGVSTSPISYKYWFTIEADKNIAKEKACYHIIEIVLELIEIQKSTGKLLHLDIEPEPDGFLENTQEVIDYFKDYLLKFGAKKIQETVNCSIETAKNYILNHIQICYDVCHFALAYEKPKEVIDAFSKNGIKVGKIQISAALKCKKSIDIAIENQIQSIKQFDEPTYLHQAVVQLNNGSLLHYPDLDQGLKAMQEPNFKEIRTHYHVPVFINSFEILQSTQSEIIEALNYWKENKFTNHLEVETYTWNVLPKELQTNITDSIIRELNWVKTIIQN